MTTETIIELLSGIDKAEIIFEKPFTIRDTSIQITGIGVDANNRLWMKNSRSNWVEVHDRLIYHKQIIKELHEQLHEFSINKV